MLPTERPGRGTPVSPGLYFASREQTQALEAVGAARPGLLLDLKGGGWAESLRTWQVSANLFDVLRVRPMAGRLFAPEHELPGGPPVVVLSHETWVRVFHANPKIVGRPLSFADGPGEVLGILPEGWHFRSSPALGPTFTLPTSSRRRSDRTTESSRCGSWARIRDGLSFEQARAAVERMASALVLPLHDQVVGSGKSWLLLALSAVGIVMLVACANVGSLLLARAVTRAHELLSIEDGGEKAPGRPAWNVNGCSHEPLLPYSGLTRPRAG